MTPPDLLVWVCHFVSFALSLSKVPFDKLRANDSEAKRTAL